MNNIFCLILFLLMKKAYKFVSLRACLVAYQDSKKDVNNHLKFVTSQLQTRVQAQAEYLKFRQRLTTYLQETRSNIKRGKKFAGFKLAMLIHYLFIYFTPLLRDKQKNQNNVKIFYFLNQLITNLHDCLDQNHKNELEKDKQFLNENVILPYVYYLQKKFQYIEIKLIQMQETGYVIPQQSPEQIDSPQNRLNLLYEQCYKYLNLLNKGLILSNKLLTLLTYYLQEYEFLENFNIILASDFSPIYTNMSERFYQIQKIQKELGLDQKAFWELERQVEKTHEGMFIVYLNRYMNHMRFLAPQFIDCSHSKTKLDIFYDQKNPQGIEKRKFNKIKKYLSMNSSPTIAQNIEPEGDLTMSQKYNDISSFKEVQQENRLEQLEGLDMVEQIRGSFKKKASIREPAQQQLTYSGGKKVL